MYSNLYFLIKDSTCLLTRSMRGLVRGKGSSVLTGKRGREDEVTMNECQGHPGSVPEVKGVNRFLTDHGHDGHSSRYPTLP